MDCYQRASKAEKDRFRSRKAYWRKQGLSEQQAIEKAMGVFYEKKVGKKIPKVLSVKPPSSEEVKAEVERQKSLGNFIETPPVILSSTNRHLKIATSPEFDDAKVTTCEPGKAVEGAWYALVVIAATAVLVQSSLEVFGTNWQGWAKAILLELGIIGLVVINEESIVEKLIAKGTLVFLLILSFTVLHTGVESHRSDKLSVATTTSAALVDLTAERDRWQKTYDGYAENRISDRRDAMKEISRLNREIRAERAAVSQSLDGSVINLKSNTEMMIRAALLLLNIIFGHKLAKIMASFSWPPIKEVRPTS